MKLFSTPPVLSGKKNKKRKKLLKAQRKALKRADHPFESDKAADCRGVVLSNRAYLSVLSEVYSPAGITASPYTLRGYFSLVR